MKLFRSLCIFLSLLVIGGALYASTSDFHKQAYVFFTKGANAYAQGDNVKAISLMEKALTMNPRLEAARGILIVALGEESILLYQDGKYDKALPNLNKLLKLLPGDAEIQQIYREARKKLPKAEIRTRIADSVEALQNQYRLDWMGYVGLGKEQTRLNERVDYLEKMYTTYAGTLVGTKEIENEMQSLVSERRLLINSYSRDKRLEEAVALYNQDRIREAIEIWEKIQLAVPDSDIERYIAEARVALEGKLQTALSEALVMKEEGKWDKAFLAWKKALSLHPEEISARLGIKDIHVDLTRILNRGVILYQEGDFSKAIEQWEKVSSLYPGFRNINQYIAQAKNMIQKGKESEKKALAKAYMRNGDALQKKGNLLAATQFWQKAAAFDPTDNTARKRIMNLLESLYKRAEKDNRTGNKKRAVKIWELIVSIDPRYSDVKKKLVKTATRASVNVTGFINEGEKSFSAGDYQNALTSLKKALRYDPRNKRAIRLAVESALAQGIMNYRSDNLKDAIALWDFVLKHDPGHSKAVKYRKRAKLKLDMLEKLK